MIFAAEFKAKLNEANRNALFHTGATSMQNLFPEFIKHFFRVDSDGPRREMTQSEKQQNSLQILKDSVATLHETEEVAHPVPPSTSQGMLICLISFSFLQVGNSIMTDLGKQKETIKHARGNLKTTNSDLKYSVCTLHFCSTPQHLSSNNFARQQGKLVAKMSKWWRG